MMLVETELRASPIHGIGVYLLEPVAAGTLVWRFDARIDRVYTQSEVESLPATTRSFLQTYCTWHDAAQLWVLCGDNGRHFNHSLTPNTRSDGVAFGTDVAAIDLAVGTELTTDYFTICDAVKSAGIAFPLDSGEASQLRAA